MNHIAWPRQMRPTTAHSRPSIYFLTLLNLVSPSLVIRDPLSIFPGSLTFIPILSHHTPIVDPFQTPSCQVSLKMAGQCLDPVWSESMDIVSPSLEKGSAAAVIPGRCMRAPNPGAL